MVVMVPCQLCVVTGTGCLGHCTPGDINCYLTGPGEGGGRQRREDGLSFDYCCHCTGEENRTELN